MYVVGCLFAIKMRKVVFSKQKYFMQICKNFRISPTIKLFILDEKPFKITKSTF